MAVGQQFRKRGFAFAAAFAGALFTAGEAAAQAPPSLSGETLTATSMTAERDCDFEGTSTVTYHTEGVATGPYAGSFTETATFTLGPQEFDPSQFFGTVTGVEVTFAIDSPAGTVTGTKHLTPEAGPPPEGSCYEDLEGHQAENFNAGTRYEATIATPVGTFADSGVANVFVGYREDFFGPGADYFEFFEVFQSSGPVLPLSTPGKATGGGKVARDVVFGFNAKNQHSGMDGNCLVTDRIADHHIRCLDVRVYAQTGTRATFSGRAEVDGVETNYRIVVEDRGEPGRGVDEFHIQTDSGYSADGVLTQGNVQVHRV